MSGFESIWSGEREAALPWRVLLGIASSGYRVGRSLHRALYDFGIARRHRFPVPVVSVGNLAVGGCGKTPFVAWLAAELTGRGKRVMVLGRGYGRPAGAALNDEGEWLAARLPRVAVVQAPDRFRAALAEMARTPVDLVLLDDGFQHEPLERDLDIVLLDARAPFGNGRLLPAGPLRESPSALARAHFLFVTRAELVAPATLEAVSTRLVRAAPRATVGTVRFEIGALRCGDNRHPPAWLAGRKIVLATGVGSPSSVRATAERLGAVVCDHVVFPDHHSFTAGDLAEAQARASRHGAVLVVTEKDAIKLARLEASVVAASSEEAPLVVLEQVPTVTAGGEALLHAVLALPLRQDAPAPISPVASSR